MHNTWIYIIIMALTTCLIRVIPVTLIRTQIKNRFIRSFLYYVPYVTLSVMTFPAILGAGANPWVGGVAFIGGVIAAWKKVSMFLVAVICCCLALAMQFVLV